jgi:hypothetical protein
MQYDKKFQWAWSIVVVSTYITIHVNKKIYNIGPLIYKTIDQQLRLTMRTKWN